ncbi:MAG: hypothetical protein RBT11_06705 [Desulfobacterales bacterium]|nr:hypothetical protein [Desulfobacterales bacterium]
MGRSKPYHQKLANRFFFSIGYQKASIANPVKAPFGREQRFSACLDAGRTWLRYKLIRGAMFHLKAIRALVR